MADNGAQPPPAVGGPSGTSSSKVFVRDDVYAWLPGEVVPGDDPPPSGSKPPRMRRPQDAAANSNDKDDKVVSVRISLPDDWDSTTFMPDHKSIRPASSSGDGEGVVRRVKLSSYPGSELPLQNVSAETGRLLGKSDMADLPHLHEAAILYNLKDRHKRGVPYTRVGDIVVAVNPYRWMDGLYTEERRAFYAERLVWNAPDEDFSNRQNILEGYFDRIMHDPHVYETSANAYGGLALGELSVDEKTTAGTGGGRRRSSIRSSVRSIRGDDRGWGMDQAILVSGESGAGKTETVKIVMRHLASISDTVPPGASASSAAIAASKENGPPSPVARQKSSSPGVVKKILESNPLFEAFGNARTGRNDNSSRFGKFTKLHFRVDAAGGGGGAGKATVRGRQVPVPVLAGSTFETYLLEKSRVVGHDDGERTYHFFYQLLGGAPEEDRKEFWEEGLTGATAESFRYVGSDPAGGQNGGGGGGGEGGEGGRAASDEEAWAETRTALADFGLRGEKLRTFMRAVCAVLQLGNLSFSPDPASHKKGEDGCVVSDPDELRKLSDLMGVSPPDLTEALTTRLVATLDEEITVRLTPAAATAGCDALAKEIYARTFDELVDTINESTRPSVDAAGGGGAAAGGGEMRSISILDMFGFESFPVNRFEQLCINYANERIQHKYASDTFLSIKDEYESEGIQIYDFAKVDNSDVLDLVEGRTGLIMVLNEECVRPKGNDESFVYKVKTIHKESGRLKSDLLHRPTEFEVLHFAGTVKYDAVGFVERNTDQLPKVLLDCAVSSKNDLIRTRFQQIRTDLENRQKNYKRKRSANTICTKFRSQLNSLMDDIRDARTRYIRCIKPNRKKLPLVMDHRITMRQLASAGLVTAITVSRETFPNRLTYEVVWDRFRVLLTEKGDGAAAAAGRRGDGGGGGGGGGGSSSTREKAERLLNELLRGKEKVVGGSVIAPFACGTTKVFFRSGSLELLESDRQRLYSAKAAILQRHARGVLTRKRMREMVAAAIKLQAQWRCAAARNHYTIQRGSVLRLQNWGRRMLAVLCVLGLRRTKAAERIQSSWRGVKPREALATFRRAAQLIQHFVRSRKDQDNLKLSMAVVVEEAQMDHKMKKLQAKLDEASAHDKDDLLRESAGMIEYLSKQLYMQRGRTWSLKAELSKERDVDGRKGAHAGSIEAALAANKLEVSRLRQTSMRLENQLSVVKSDKASTRMLLKSIQEEHKAEKSKHEEEIGKVKHSHSDEIERLNAEIRHMKKAHERQVTELKQNAATSERRLSLEVTKLQKEIEKSEESYEDDVAKVLDALQIAHEEDTRRRKPAENEEELKRRLSFLEKSYEAELKDLKESLCERCKSLCQNRGLMNSPDLQRSMGSLSRGMGSRHLFS